MAHRTERELLDREIVRGIQAAFGVDEPQAFASLVDDFLETGEASLASIEEAIADKDWDEARQISHRLKGMSSQLGASALKHLSSELERQLDHNPTRSLLDRVSRMKAVLHQTAEAYDCLIDRVGCAE